MSILRYIERIKRENEGPRITAQEPRNMVDGGRIGFMKGKLVKHGPNTGKWVVRDLYSRGDKRGSTLYFNSETEASQAIADRKAETGKQQTNAELTKKYKKFLKEEGYKTWDEAPKDIKKKLKNKLASSLRQKDRPKVLSKITKLLKENPNKVINPHTGLPYTVEEYEKSTVGKKGVISKKLRGIKKPGHWAKRQGWNPEKEANRLLVYMKKAAEQQGKLPIKDRTYTNVFVDGKFVGVNDIKKNKLWTHIDYDLSQSGAKKGTSIAAQKNGKFVHPDMKNFRAFFDMAQKFKYDTPNKLLGSYFSKYERVPSYNEIYNFFTIDRNAPVSMMKKHNALTIQHQSIQSKKPTKDLQLLLNVKNTEANTIMNRFKRGEISKARADYELKKIGAAQEGLGVPKEKITPGKGIAVAKRETVDLFKKRLMANPKLVEEMTKKLEINLKALCPKGKASGGRIGYQTAGSVGATVECGINELNKQLKNGVSKGQVPLIRKILSGGANFFKQVLDPATFFKLENWIGKPAAIAMGAFETAMVADDVLRKGKPLNETAAENWIFGNLLGLDAQVAQAKNIIDDPSLSPAAKEYAQSIIDTEKYFKSGLGPIEEKVASVLPGSDKYLKARADLKNKILDVGETGRFDYESALTDKQDAASAGEYVGEPKKVGPGYYVAMDEDGNARKVNEYGYAIKGESFDAPDKPGLPSFTSGFASAVPNIGKDKALISAQTKKQFVPGEYVQKKGQLPEAKVIDVPAYVSETFKPDLPTRGDVNRIYQELGYVHPIGGEVPEKYAEELITQEKWRQLFEQPGIRGSQDWKGAGGGLANLTRTVAPDSGPMSQGLRSLYINDKDY